MRVSAQSELRLYEKKEIEELENRLNQRDLDTSTEVGMRFIEALFDKEGGKAVESFKKLVQQNPNSKEIPAIIERIALFQFASGLYNTARETFLFLDRKYSNTDYGERGLYYVSRCWLAIGTADSAKSTIIKFHEKYPHSKLNNTIKLTLYQDNSYSSQTKKSNRKSVYSVQTGAFSTLNNARIQKQFIENKGHDADIYIKIVNNKKYYVVCVGKFDSNEEAEKLGRLIDRKYRTKFQLVNLTQFETVK